MTAGRRRLQPPCTRLGISRDAVHKHVKSLRSRGYRILGISRRGYRLEEEPSRLFMRHITDRTIGSRFGSSYRYYDEMESMPDWQ